MARLLIVDDDQSFLDVLSRLLVGRGYEVFTTDNGEMALQWLSEQAADLLICDLKMSPMSGTDVLKTVQEKHSALTVIMMTSHGTVDTALECLRMGAFDYVTKPFKVQEFIATIERALAWDPGKITDVQDSVVPYGLGQIAAKSAAMMDVCTRIEQVAPSDATVLFVGEPSVGKKLVGRTLHDISPRQPGPFIVADCANVPPPELALRLFGSAPDASQPNAEPNGLFAMANGGTIWLDNVGALSLELQERLLRALKDQVIQPVGALEPISVNVRVLAGTTMNIDRAVALGEFRGDLFARFAPITVKIPPLRERREDIIPLLWHFLRRQLGAAIALPGIDPDARGLLLHYHWPGNACEVDTFARKLLESSVPERITRRMLPEDIIRSVTVAAAAPLSIDASGRAKSLKAFLSRQAGMAAGSATPSKRPDAK